MLKISGLILILFFCSYAGVSFYKTTIYRVGYIADIIEGLRFMRKELEFSEGLLEDVLAAASEYSGKSKNLFMNCAVDFKNCKKNIENENVSPETKTICKKFFGQIGKSNLENELNLIDVTIGQLEALYSQEKAYSEKNGKLIAKTGVLMGLLLFVLLL